MNKDVRLAVHIYRDGDWFVAHCLDLDIASQGETVEKAKDNLVEALTLWFETASPEEIKYRLPAIERDETEVFETHVRIPIHGPIASAVG